MGGGTYISAPKPASYFKKVKAEESDNPKHILEYCYNYILSPTKTNKQKLPGKPCLETRSLLYHISNRETTEPCLHVKKNNTFNFSIKEYVQFCVLVASLMPLGQNSLNTLK